MSDGSMGNTGVLLVKGSSTKFTDITAVTSDEDAVYIELEDSGLKTGDVVLQGTGEDAAQVTLSELLPHAGVYVANSSIAKFVVIDVVEQNQEYAIVQAGSTTGCSHTIRLFPMQKISRRATAFFKRPDG